MYNIDEVNIMIIRSVEKPITITDEAHYPDGDRNEFLFVGRSNVGKSSLINSLLNRKNIAYTSQTPGKTQTLNFYLINESFYIVDVPGYGYARVSKTMRRDFAEMIEHYLTTRKQLRHIFVLVDLRHPPSDDDFAMAQYLSHYNMPFTILATKADKISKNKRPKHIKMVKETLALPATVEIVPYSSMEHLNRDRVLRIIESYE